MQNIREALMKLDSMDDEQWTNDGAPKVDVVSELVGEKVSRQDIISAAPKFTRENMVVDTSEPEDEESMVPEEEEEDEDDFQSAPRVESDVEDILEFDSRTFERFLQTSDVAVMRDAKEQLEELSATGRKTIAQLNDRLRTIDNSLARMRHRIEELSPGNSNGEAIREYINSQNRAREEAHGRRTQILQHISPKDLDPRSPLDAAMARKTARGTQRPGR